MTNEKFDPYNSLSSPMNCNMAMMKARADLLYVTLRCRNITRVKSLAKHAA